MDEEIEIPEDILQSIDCPIFTVKRHEGQLLAEIENARQTIIDGGNRVGKTEFGAQEASAIVHGYRPWLPPEHPLYKMHTYGRSSKVRIFGEDLRKGVGQILVPKILKYLPKYMIKGVKRDSTTGVIIHIDCASGATIDFLTYEMDPDAMEGWDGDWIWFDEPPPRNVYIANWRGMMDRMGRALFTGTPLKEPWISEELVANARVVHECEKDMDTMEFKTNKIMMNGERDIVALTWDITVNLGYGLTKQAIEDFAASLTEEEKQCRLHGKPLHFTGKVFKKFDRNIHVKSGKLSPKVPYTYYEAVDTHPRHPHAYSFYAVDDRGTVIKYDEIYDKEQPNGSCDAKELSHLVMMKRPKDAKGNPIRPVWTKCEPAAWVDHMETGSFASKLEEASNFEIILEPGIKDVAGRILAINEMLDAPNGIPSYIILDNCTATIKEYQTLVWQEFKGAVADRKTPSNKPVDKGDHFIEDDGRAFMAGMPFLEQMAWLNGVPFLQIDEDDEVETKRSVNSVTGY